MGNAYETTLETNSTLSLKTLKTNDLITSLKDLVTKERKLTAEILRYLQEVERRRFYLELGYSRLFDYITRALGYSEDAACRRISAMRLLKDFSETEKTEIESRLTSGALSLTTVANAARFFISENKARAEASHSLITSTEKKEILKEISYKSKREVKEILLEKSHIKVEEKTELKLNFTKTQFEKLQKLKALLSNRNPSGTTEELLEILMNDGLSKYDPAEKEKRATKILLTKTSSIQNVSENKSLPCPGKVEQTRHSVPLTFDNKTSTLAPCPDRVTALYSSKTCKTISRHIPNSIKRAVYLRDKGKCTYKNCQSTHYLQYDHITPYSFNGAHTVENLRLLCSAHHRIETERLFS